MSQGAGIPYSTEPPPPPPPPGEAEVFKCPNCGAPIEVTPDSLVVKCRYCGYVEYRDPGYDVFVFPSLSREEITRRFWDRMRSDSDMGKYVNKISIDSITSIFVPFYVVDYDAQYFFVGERRETRTRTVNVGGRVTTQTEVRIVKVRDSGSVSGVDAILGRRHIEELGVKELSTQVKQLDISAAVHASKYKWGKEVYAVMGFDIEPKEVNAIARDVIAEKLKTWVKRKYRLDRLNVYLCRVNVKDFKAVLVPIYIITYKFRNAIYSIAFSGVDGRQLVAIEPVLTKHLVMYLGGAAAATFVASLALPFALRWGHIIFLGVALVIGAGYLVSRALGGVRFER